jgi:hypothetical protein
LPKHSLQDGGYILRVGWAGCRTFADPVPSQAGHLISAPFRLRLFIKLRLKKGALNQIRRCSLNLPHIVVMN